MRKCGLLFSNGQNLFPQSRLVNLLFPLIVLRVNLYCITVISTEPRSPIPIRQCIMAGSAMNDIRHLILSSLYSRARADSFHWKFTWDDEVMLRQSLVRHEHGNPQGWLDFVMSVSSCKKLTEAVREALTDDGFISWNYDAIFLGSQIAAESKEHCLIEINDLLEALKWHKRSYEPLADARNPTTKNKTEIMYVEAKPGLTGPGRIVRVQLSKTGRTVYYQGLAFLPSKSGYKWNYFEVTTGEHYWISRCRKDGQDSLYPAIIQIDEDVREEYWRNIREQPELQRLSSFRSEGKHGRHRK